MKQTVNFYDFDRAFELADRLDNFSYDGRRALFDYLEQYEDDCDIELELDVIGLCCDFTEFENLAEYNDAYSVRVVSLEELAELTTVIRIPNSAGFIIANF